jgi:hypothetical protein
MELASHGAVGRAMTRPYPVTVPMILLVSLVPFTDRRVAPSLALCVSGFVGLGVVCYWVAYQRSARL